MTAYKLKPLDTLPSLAWQEAKSKRRRVLEAVRKRRGERYKQFLQKLQNRRLHADRDLL
jgi:hypothetical protein